MISTREKVNQVPLMKRKSDRLMTIKTGNLVGPRKNFDDPLVIHEEEKPIGVSTKRIKS